MIILQVPGVELEKKVREKWRKNETFHRSISNREGEEPFVFYEGPPTANGLPHAGHALGRTIKDFVARYKTMRGYQVIRKAGWDTHGLPVELEVEKQLNIRGKEQIEAYGIENFIQKCKESVFAYENEWKQFTESLGYWVDMEDPYVTLSNEYIESVWNILSTIHEQGYLYKGHRVVPYCPRCETSLSSHEVAQGYKDVSDLSVTAKFKVQGSSNEYFLGWTTTPWTLPGNVALAVNPDMKYVKVKLGSKIYILAERLLDMVINQEYEIVEVMNGSSLIGLLYEPLFDFVEVEKGYEVIGADFVTETSGTGIVHLAPAHGEDDYKAVEENHFDFVNVVDSQGRYKEEVTPLAGRFVKDCDVEIIKMLSTRNLLFNKEKYEHSYPHCWRCDSPLLYYAMEGWFVKTTALKEKMIENNQDIDWYPSHIKNGRFGNFLNSLVDWNIGRNRYWGTPLNVWICKQCGKEKAPNSISEVNDLSVDPLDTSLDLHKPYVDQIVLSCSCGGEMYRTKEVIDVWFDSGSMPFAQYHYPFENRDLFEKQFPADVVIEGIDQTRGWFYSLLAVSTLYTGKSSYKRALSLGHILDEHGQKMSKSKGNALNPTELMNEFGADSLRWALLADSSPWNNKRFSKKTVSLAKSKVIDTLFNIYSFYKLYADIDHFDPEQDWSDKKSTLDQWILSRLNTVIEEVTQSLDDFEVTRGARAIATLVEELSNWYVRRSRQRFWNKGMTEDKKAAFSTLYEVLKKLTQLMAPYTPFIAEEIYSKLMNDSVHLSDFPKTNNQMIDEQLEEDMSAVLQVIEQTRSLRNSTGLKTKQPLAQLVVKPTEGSSGTNLYKYSSIIKEEVNIKNIIFTDDVSDLMKTEFKLNFPVLGPKLGKKIGEVKRIIERLTDEEKEQFLQKQLLQITLESGERIELKKEDVIINKEGKESFVVFEGDQYVTILDTDLTEELKDEGLVREFIRVVQTYRKELNLPVDLRIDLYVDTDREFKQILKEYNDLIETNLILQDIYFEVQPNMKKVSVEDFVVNLHIDS